MRNILLMFFLALCAGTLISDSVFPIIIYVVKALIFISMIIFFWLGYDNLYKYLIVYNRLKKETVYKLIFKMGIWSGIVNLLTVSRIILAPILLYLAFSGSDWFKWILLYAFLSDAADGFLARKFKVTSRLGTKLDSIADDILFVTCMVAIIYVYPAIFIDHILLISCLTMIFLFKIIVLLCKHSTLVGGMHTYLTKGAAFVQAVFFISTCFFGIKDWLLITALICTMAAITEEIIILFAFKELQQNIKGLFFKTNKPII